MAGRLGCLSAVALLAGCAAGVQHTPLRTDQADLSGRSLVVVAHEKPSFVAGSAAKGMFGGKLPWTMIGIGALIGAVVIAFDEWLKSRKSSFRVPVLAAAIGIYLPLELMVPIFLGGLLSWFVEKRLHMHADTEEGRDRIHRPGVLFSAGLITGEALMGIFIAIPIVVSSRGDVLALPESMRTGEGIAQLLGLAVLAFVAWLLFRTAIRSHGKT